MKYLIVQYDKPKITTELTKLQLGYARDGVIECIINLEDMTYFDGDANEWKEVPSEN